MDTYFIISLFQESLHLVPLCIWAYQGTSPFCNSNLAGHAGTTGDGPTCQPHEVQGRLNGAKMTGHYEVNSYKRVQHTYILLCWALLRGLQQFQDSHLQQTVHHTHARSADAWNKRRSRRGCHVGGIHAHTRTHAHTHARTLQDLEQLKAMVDLSQVSTK